MQTLDELRKQNLWLFDALFREQVYLEGWRTSLANNYRTMLRRLYGEFAVYLGQTRYTSMDQFTKVQLAAFIRRFIHAQDAFYSSFTASLIKLLQDFLEFDLDASKQILQQATGKTVAEAQQTFAGDPNAKASGMYGTAALDDAEQLWANVRNSPIPANGMLLEDMLNDFGDDNDKRVTLLITKAYANAASVPALQNKLLGTGNDFAGGLFGLLLNQFTAIVATAVQHVNSEVVAAVSSAYFERYQWVSVLDSHTTQICIDRNGNVYVYGEGPLPPAHYFCRSKTIGIATPDTEHDIPNSAYDWLLTQPRAFLVDVLGESQADALEAGELSPNDFLRISPLTPLTLAELKGKLKYILDTE